MEFNWYAAAYVGIGYLMLECTLWAERRRGNSPMKLGPCLWIVFGWPVVVIGILLTMFRGVWK